MAEEAKKANQTENDDENAVLNNYMGEFKVATFKVRPKTQEELEFEKKLMENDGEFGGMEYKYGNRMDEVEHGYRRMKTSKEKGSNVDVGFWNDLLEANIEKERQKAYEVEMKKLANSGRGKRVRKLVDYRSTACYINWSNFKTKHKGRIKNYPWCQN